MNARTPHRGEVSLVVIILIVIVFIAVGFYAGTFFTNGSSATSTPVAMDGDGSVDPYADTGTWQIDTRTDAGFRIASPSDFAVVNGTAAGTDWRMNAGAASGVKAFMLAVPQSFEPNTNFSDAKLTVGYSADAQAVKDCLMPDPTGGPAGASSTVNVNGTVFTVFTSNDAGAGNLYDTTSYRAVHDGSCYAIEYTIHSTQLANYPADSGITQFDEPKVESLLARIVNTFAFL